GRAPLSEGDLFGEMSCLYRTPRSATVVADRDCFMVEFLRHILEQLHRDAAYKARSAVYLKRILDLQVRKMPLFRELTDQQFEEIRPGLELVSFNPGETVCDEHERADCLYVVRTGLVRVLKNASHLLSAADVIDWNAFAEALRKGAAGAPG